MSEVCVGEGLLHFIVCDLTVSKSTFYRSFIAL